MKYLKNITRFGLNFTFLAKVTGFVVHKSGRPRATLRRYFVLLPLYFPCLLHVIILMRVLIACGAPRDPSQNHTRQHVATLFAQIERNKIRNVFEMGCLDCSNNFFFSKFQQNKFLINNFSPISSIFCG